MTEKDLLYYFPYRIDKELNFRHYANKHDEFVRRYAPNYNGTNVHDFIKKKSNLSQSKINEFEYIYLTYRNWREWYKNGKNIFSFSKELLQMLEKTDVNEIKPDSFHLPYDNFYLSLKPLNIKIAEDREEIIEGVFIDHNTWNPSGEHPEGYCDLSFYFAGDFKSVFNNYLPHVKSRIVFADGEYIEYPLGDFWNIWLNFEKAKNRETVKQAIDHFIINFKEEIFPKSDTQNNVTDFELDFYNSTLKLLDKTLNLIINCMLYLSQPTSKKEIDKKIPNGLPNNFDKKISFAKTENEIRKVENKIESLGFTKINFVGQSFKRSHNALLNNPTPQSHWRRGHWRNQKFGKNLMDNKVIWILPTIVNKEKGEPQKGHLYDTKN